VQLELVCKEVYRSVQGISNSVGISLKLKLQRIPTYKPELPISEAADLLFKAMTSIMTEFNTTIHQLKGDVYSDTPSISELRYVIHGLEITILQAELLSRKSYLEDQKDMQSQLTHLIRDVKAATDQTVLLHSTMAISGRFDSFMHFQAFSKDTISLAKPLINPKKVPALAAPGDQLTPSTKQELSIMRELQRWTFCFTVHIYKSTSKERCRDLTYRNLYHTTIEMYTRRILEAQRESLVNLKPFFVENGPDETNCGIGKRLCALNLLSESLNTTNFQVTALPKHKEAISLGLEIESD
jgi:hypothetical protein